MAAGSSAGGRRPQKKPAATRAHEPTRRGDGPPDRVVRASCRHAFLSLCSDRARGRGTTPARSIELGRGHRDGRATPIEQNTGPAVKTSSPCLPPRDALCAVGGIRAWGENPGRRASSPTTVHPFGAFAGAHLKKFGTASPRRSADSSGSRRRRRASTLVRRSQPQNYPPPARVVLPTA